MPAAAFIVGIFALVAIAVGALGWVLATSAARGRQRLAALAASESQTASPVPQVSGVRPDVVPVLTSFLQGTALWQELQLQLIRAGLMLRPSEFVALSLLGALVVTGASWLLFRQLASGLFLGAVAAVLPYVYMKARQGKRVRDLASQLPDALDMLSSSLRSGFALMRAMQVVRTQMHPPIAVEFGRVVDEVQYGIPIEEALDNLIVRTGSYDLELVVAAVQTQLTVGGNLAEIFESIAGMIRERVRLMGEISAATAEGRLSAGILLALPFAMAFMVNLVNPGYLKPLFSEPVGLMMVGVGLVLMAVGALVIRKLVDIDV